LSHAVAGHDRVFLNHTDQRRFVGDRGSEQLAPRGREFQGHDRAARVSDDVNGCQLAAGDQRGKVRHVFVDAALRGEPLFALAVSAPVVGEDAKRARQCRHDGIRIVVITP
jgi:hypothetical protein